MVCCWGVLCYLSGVMVWQRYGNVPRRRVRIRMGRLRRSGRIRRRPGIGVGGLGGGGGGLGVGGGGGGPVVVVVACGLMSVPWRPARQFAVPLVGAFLPIAALVAWIFMSMELFFTPY